jgi:phosphoribosyl 1,2-cyclic phosphodiesterase
MRFASLGSGSRGNALLVEAGSTRVLLDCGFGPRELEARLARLGVTPHEIDAVLVTHEHGDHVSGVAKCAARFDFEIFLSHGTAVAAGIAEDGNVFQIDSHAAFGIGDLEIQPFPVPHDAREPTQFVIGNGQNRLGVLTDAGCVTPHMVAMLDGCDALVLECNHDSAMLRASSYPPSLKQRIGGRLGHLSNEAAGDLLQRIDKQRLKHVVAAHLSEQNNRADLAQGALASVLGCNPHEVAVANQQQGFTWRQL